MIYLLRKGGVRPAPTPAAWFPALMCSLGLALLPTLQWDRKQAERAGRPEKLRVGQGATPVGNVIGWVEDGRQAGTHQFATCPDVLARYDKGPGLFWMTLDSRRGWKLTTPDPKATIDPSVAGARGGTDRWRLHGLSSEWGRGSRATHCWWRQGRQQRKEHVLKVPADVAHNDRLARRGRCTFARRITPEKKHCCPFRETLTVGRAARSAHKSALAPGRWPRQAQRKEGPALSWTSLLQRFVRRAYLKAVNQSGGRRRSPSRHQPEKTSGIAETFWKTCSS